MKIDSNNARAYLAHIDQLEQWALMHTNAASGRTLYARLRRLELKANRMAAAYCNGEIDGPAWEKFQDTTTRTVERIFGGTVQGFFVNGDPRGYALKIDNENATVPEGMHKDWGGYGILAPQF